MWFHWQKIDKHQFSSFPCEVDQPTHFLFLPKPFLKVSIKRKFIFCNIRGKMIKLAYNVICIAVITSMVRSMFIIWRSNTPSPRRSAAPDYWGSSTGEDWASSQNCNQAQVTRGEGVGRCFSFKSHDGHQYNFWVIEMCIQRVYKGGII